MVAVFKRELKSYFTTPVGFIILAAFYFFLGLYFEMIYSYGSPDVPYVINVMYSITIFATPIITMRLLSEDRRQKVDQVLFTSPVTLTGVVMGKFLAALALYAIAFAPTVIFEIIVASYVSVNLLSFLYSLFGAMLLGATLIAIGMFISSLTESPALAAILSLVINIVVLYMGSFASMVSAEWAAKIFESVAFLTVFENFSTEIFSIPDVIYFLSITAAFIFLSVRSLEKRRWA
ncbi:MAG: ABC transporter permease [Clostridia bacterium]|nr:ABC transporter permease [Clostridia bacterium]